MLPLEMRMNTRVPAESYPDDVIVITGDDDFDKLEQNPDCVCVVVKGCSTIELGAFENMKQLRQVILCGDIQHILPRAFAGCSKLSEIDLPDSVKTIGFCAFKACTSLERVRLPHGLEEIESDVFGDCERLKEIRIPAAVTLIESTAFANCTALERVYGGEGLETVENAAFLNCKSLKHFPFSPSVCDIHAGAFESCPLHLPVTYYHALSPRAKYGSGNIAVPDGVQTIGSFAFGSRTRNSVALPDSVRNISRYAFADWDKRVEGYPLDYTRYLPAEMNMPKGYLRQKEPFDALMALALCDTVWKNAANEEDYASIALFQNDETARFLAAEKLNEKDRQNPYMRIQQHALDYMLAHYRPIPGDLLHLAEFLSFFGQYHNDEHIDRLCREAAQCGAWKAVELLEKYCRQKPEGTPYICTFISPYEADWLLERFRFDNAGLIGESDLRNFSGERMPKEFVRSMLVSSMRDDALKTLLPGYSSVRKASDSEEYKKAFDSVCEANWLELLRRNPGHDRHLLTMMCRYGSDSMLEKLFEHYCRLSEDWSHTEEVVKTDMWLQAFRHNESYTAKRICAQLCEILEDLEDVEEYELEDGDFDWEESAAAEENNEPDTPVFFDDTYQEEGMDIFGEHYADADEEYDEEDDV